MTLAAAGLGDKLGSGKTQAAEVAREHYAREQRCRARSAAHAQRNLIVQRELQRHDGGPGMREHVAVGVEDEIVIEHRTEFRIAARSGDGEGWCGVRFDGEVHGEREAHSIEAGA